MKHTVFNVNGEALFSLIDEAWLQRKLPVPGDPRAYVIEVGKVIGTQGETAIRIAVDSEKFILTAYPVK